MSVDILHKAESQKDNELNAAIYLLQTRIDRLAQEVKIKAPELIVNQEIVLIQDALKKVKKVITNN